jgi:hypothetical protein
MQPTLFDEPEIEMPDALREFIEWTTHKDEEGNEYFTGRLTNRHGETLYQSSECASKDALRVEIWRFRNHHGETT